MRRLYTMHLDVMSPHVKDKLGIDLEEFWSNNSPSLLEFDDKITSKLFGYSDVYDYYHRSCCQHILQDIRVPTFFMNALDDPVVGSFLAPEKFKSNPIILLGSTQYGGHLGYHSHFWEQ